MGYTQSCAIFTLMVRFIKKKKKKRKILGILHFGEMYSQTFFKSRGVNSGALQPQYFRYPRSHWRQYSTWLNSRESKSVWFRVGMRTCTLFLKYFIDFFMYGVLSVYMYVRYWGSNQSPLKEQSVLLMLKHQSSPQEFIFKRSLGGLKVYIAQCYSLC